MNFIEELFYDNLNAQPQNTKPNKVLEKDLKVLDENEEILLKILKDDAKKLFVEYANAWSTVNGEDMLECFINGFRLGANFTYDAFFNKLNLLKE